MAEAGWRELRIEVQGRPVFVRVGPQVPGSTPLVHVHGFAVSGSYLLPTARALAHRATAVVPDLPGYGRSAAWGHALGMPSPAWALLEIHVISCWLDGREITDDPDQPGVARVLQIRRGDA